MFVYSSRGNRYLRPTHSARRSPRTKPDDAHKQYLLLHRGRGGQLGEATAHSTRDGSTGTALGVGVLPAWKGACPDHPVAYTCFPNMIQDIISFLPLHLKVFTLMLTPFRSLGNNSFRQLKINRSLGNTWMTSKQVKDDIV